VGTTAVLCGPAKTGRSDSTGSGCLISIRGGPGSDGQ
jgi:hypothetical protein